MTVPYITNFAIKEKYQYLVGFGNIHVSEAFPGSVPEVNNHPQRPPYALRTEKISGTSFTAQPRSSNLFAYLYRARPSYDQGVYEPYRPDLETANPPAPKNLTPNPYLWPTYKLEKGDWTVQHLLGASGSPEDKVGVAVWLFHVDRDLPPQTAFSSLDGETLITIQSGALDIQTEFGKLLVRQSEIAVIPRGVRYRVNLIGDKSVRGFVTELYQGHFQLPNLGIIGSTGLAGARDFQVPTAFFEGRLANQGGEQIAVADNGSGKWTVVSRLGRKLWSMTQDSTPFNVAGWQGTLYPYKYDIRRFNYIANLNFDHADPSVFVILTSPAYNKEPGTAVVDFAVVSSRWNSPEQTLWVPWYHRNTASELVFPIINEQDPNHPLNKNDEFGPWGAWLNSNMATHGSSDEELAEWSSKDTTKPVKLMDGPVSSGIIETETPLLLSDWAYKAAKKSFKNQTGLAFEQ